MTAAAVSLLAALPSVSTPAQAFAAPPTAAREPREAELARLDGLLAQGDTAGAASFLRELRPALDADDRFALDAIHVLVGRRAFDAAREEWGRVGVRIQESVRAASAKPQTPADEQELKRRVAEAWFVQGLLAARFGTKEEALRLLKDADGLGFPPLDSPLMRLAASCLQELEEPALAAQAWREVLKGSPDDTQARLALGVALLATGNAAGARTELEEVRRRAPETPGAGFYLGVLLFEQKRYAEARPHLEGELALDPRCAGCMARLAHVAYVEGDEAQCRAWLEKATALDPTNGEASLVSGMLAYRSGSYEEAIRHLSRVIERSPGYAQAHYQLALAYQRSGNAEKAREHLARYTRLVQEQKARGLGVRGAE